MQHNEKLRLKLKKINPSCVLADNLFGKEHTIRHKMIAGLILMIFGVTFSKIVPLYLHHPVAHGVADGVGYLFHGLGAMPYGEWLSTTAGVIVGATQTNE